MCDMHGFILNNLQTFMTPLYHKTTIQSKQ